MVYKPVYDFTNENVDCLKGIYNFENSKVLSVVGSGDQYFTSLLNGSKQVDLFDKNPTSYLYFLLKFYAIRELTYEEFYNLLVLKDFKNIDIYNKLEKVLPVEVLKYYKHLIENNKRNRCFRKDGIDIKSNKSIHYYFNDRPIIPYLKRGNYYTLKEILKDKEIPKFFKGNILDFIDDINSKYDIILMSNVYDYIYLYLDEYTKLLKYFNCNEIQAHYDWFGIQLKEFIEHGYSYDVVIPSPIGQYREKENYVYTLRK